MNEEVFEVFFALFMVLTLVLAIVLPIILLKMRLKAGKRMKKSLLQLEECITVLKSRERELQDVEGKLREEVDTVYPDIKRISFYANELVQSEKAYRRQLEEYNDIYHEACANLSSLCLKQNLCGGTGSVTAIGYHMKHAKLLKMTKDIKRFRIDEELILRTRRVLKSA